MVDHHPIQPIITNFINKSLLYFNSDKIETIGSSIFTRPSLLYKNLAGLATLMCLKCS